MAPVSRYFLLMCFLLVTTLTSGCGQQGDGDGIEDSGLGLEALGANSYVYTGEAFLLPRSFSAADSTFDISAGAIGLESSPFELTGYGDPRLTHEGEPIRIVLSAIAEIVDNRGHELELRWTTVNLMAHDADGQRIRARAAREAMLAALDDLGLLPIDLQRVHEEPTFVMRFQQIDRNTAQWTTDSELLVGFMGEGGEEVRLESASR
jgi:hypothetical protein